MMWKKPRVNDQQVEKTPDACGATIYLEAYRYALDLCDNPAIAREVAARFSKSWKAREQTITECAIKLA
jgi:hypothetical protein